MSPSRNMNSRQQYPNYSRLKGKCVPTCTVDPSVVPFAHRTSWLAHGDGHPHKTRLSPNGNMQKLPRDPSMPWRQPPLTPGFHRPPQVNVSPVNWCQRTLRFPHLLRGEDMGVVSVDGFVIWGVQHHVRNYEACM